MTLLKHALSENHQLRELLGRFLQTRGRSLKLCITLNAEDMQVQSMEDASPTKWHLAHTTWFFETFILKSNWPDYKLYDRDFLYLFNSYYNGLGPQFKRADRGLLTRPSIDRVLAYRKHVDKAMESLFFDFDSITSDEIIALLELGIQHEQQHQELMLTDIKHAFYQNPLFPPVLPEEESLAIVTDSRLDWLSFDAGIYAIGHIGEAFCFDNETPKHRVYLEPFRIASRLTTNAEYLSFIETGGYECPEFWLSEAWQLLNKNPRKAPLYWQMRDQEWFQFTLNGLRTLDRTAPVTHVNYYEADAFARWCGRRLPTEQEWEVASCCTKVLPDLANADIAGAPTPSGPGLRQMFNCVWQWTTSSYAPYPGYRPWAGTVGEYNGKFMVNQYVLRGGSIATPAGHIRNTYRNFFYPGASWQFTGFRLADS